MSNQKLDIRRRPAVTVVGTWSLCGWLLCAWFLSAGCDSHGPMTVTDIDPKAGDLRGDQPVKILGNNFRRDIGYTIYFGPKKITTVSILNDKALMVRSPAADKSGTVDVIVSSDDGNDFKISGAFTYEDMSGNIVEKLGEHK